MKKTFFKNRIVIGITASVSAVLLEGQLRYTREQGYEVFVISSPGKEIEALTTAEGATLIPIQMNRVPSLLADLAALIKIIFKLAVLRPEVVNCGTPKAGFLIMISAFITRVPIRIYTLRGLRYTSFRGWKKVVLQLIERINCYCANRVICVSESLRSTVITDRILRREKSTLLGLGSSNGINLKRFERRDELDLPARELRDQLEIPQDAIIIGFVGRIVPRKGIEELLASWRKVSQEFNNIYLLIVGSLDPQQPISSDAVELIKNGPRIKILGHEKFIEKIFYALDIFVLPTYDEGFSNVLLQATAMELPIIATDVTGSRDVVQDGITGRLVPPRDSLALAEMMRFYITNPEIRAEHGKSGKKWAVNFDSVIIWNELIDLYSQYRRTIYQR